MGETWELKAVKDLLKQVLRQKKISYRKLAEEMDLSEITIKRIFSTEDISFIRLQQICELAGISLFDLIALVNESTDKPFSLSEKQELQLSKDESLYNFYTLLLKYGSIKTACQKGNFIKVNIPKLLRELDELGLIEIPIGDKVHMKHKGVLTWIKGGPLQKKFMSLRHHKYIHAFESRLSSENTFLSSSQRQLRPETVAEMKKDLDFIIQKYRSIAYREEKIFDDDKLIEVAWLVGLGEYCHTEGIGPT